MSRTQTKHKTCDRRRNVTAIPWTRRPLTVGLTAAFAFAPSSVHASFGTRVLTAVEPETPFPEIWFGVGFEHRRHSANISRELILDDITPPMTNDFRELTFSEYTHRLLVDMRVGVFHDLEFHVQVPFILENRSEIGFQDGVEGVSSIWNPSAPSLANNPDVPWAYPLTEVPAARERAGLGDMVFGLAWAPFVESKDMAHPTVALRVDITVPTGSWRDPTDPASLPSVRGRGGVGLGQTIIDLSTDISRRIGHETPSVDPYLQVGGRLPIATGAQDRAGLEPPPSARFRIGSELVLFDDPDRRVRHAVDLGFGVRYVASGRTYSELSDYLPSFDQTRVAGDPVYNDYANPQNYRVTRDGARCGLLQGVPCGELNQVADYVELSGTLAFHVQPVDWLLFRGGLTVGFVNDHLITGERAGEDLDPPSAANENCPPANPTSPCRGRVNAENSQGFDERSPYYDPRYDQPGRRLRVEDVLDINAFIMTTLTF